MPFDRDIERTGAYLYTGRSRLSAQLANGRFTELILSSVDFNGKRVVDVGSGDGTYTAELAQRSGAVFVVGIDPSRKAVERAESVYGRVIPNVHFVYGAASELLGRRESFDIAVYRGVIHHVADPRTELQKGLALAETVIVLEPNGLNPIVKVIERASRYHLEHEEKSFSPFTLAKWLTSGGGVVRSIRFFGMVPHFSPDVIARVGRFLEPWVENIPLVRAAYCGQYLLIASRKH